VPAALPDDRFGRLSKIERGGWGATGAVGTPRKLARLEDRAVCGRRLKVRGFGASSTKFAARSCGELCPLLAAGLAQMQAVYREFRRGFDGVSPAPSEPHKS